MDLSEQTELAYTQGIQTALKKAGEHTRSREFFLARYFLTEAEHLYQQALKKIPSLDTDIPRLIQDARTAYENELKTPTTSLIPPFYHR